MTPDTLSAAAYHRLTSYRREHMEPHFMDWENQPALWKRYPKRPQIRLDREVKLPETNYFSVVKTGLPHAGLSSELNLAKISALLRLTHTATAQAQHGSQPFFYRSVASAGALYPFELYLGGHRIEGMDPGLYHYDLFDFALTALRREPIPVFPLTSEEVTATFYITGIVFRSAWKYRSRAYRYVLLDGGHLLENLRLALSALGFAADIQLDFDDVQAAHLLGLDPDREVCLACIHIAPAKPQGPTGNRREKRLLATLDSEILQAGVVSRKEISYPDILRIHRGGNCPVHTIATADPVNPVPINPAALPEIWTDLDPPQDAAAADYLSVLYRRRSRRNFISTPISRPHLMVFLNTLADAMGETSGVPSKYRFSLTVGLLVNGNGPLPAGFYLLDSQKRKIGRLFGKTLIQSMAAACLDQMWLQNAALHVLFLTDPACLDRQWGARGYRYAMMEAGRLGQQAYLAATALGLGACGIGAIYDKQAANLLSLDGDGVLLYLVGIGPVKGGNTKR
jgi:SagB-type dehydrogenase family enzyme